MRELPVSSFRGLRAVSIAAVGIALTVLAGMALAARYSAQQGRISESDAARLVKLLASLGLGVAPPRFSPEVWLSFMGRDKKNEAGRITLILLDALGRGAIVKGAPAEELRDFLAKA